MTNRRAFLYVIGSGKPDAPVKIGIAFRVEARLAFLQTGSPVALKILHRLEVPADIARKAEAACHRRLRTKRLKGEWFDVPRDLAVATVRDVVTERPWEKPKPRRVRPPAAKGAILHMQIDRHLKDAAQEMARADGVSVTRWLSDLLRRKTGQRARKAG